MPVLAIIISILSLMLSLHTSFSTRRADQLQRLAAIRTKLSSLIWKIHYDLSQYEHCAKKFDQFIGGEVMKFEQSIAFLKEGIATIEELKSKLDSMSSKLSRFPLLFGAGQIDDIEHRVDSTYQSVDMASEKLLPRMIELAGHIESASVLQGSLSGRGDR